MQDESNSVVNSDQGEKSSFTGGNVILIGSMGSGKTAVGRVLARYLRKGFFDLDAWLEKKNGKSVAEVFKQKGEPYFREQEQQGIAYLQNVRQHVVALGGGTLDVLKDPGELQRLGFVVWLSPEIDEIVKRFNFHREEVAKRPYLADLADEESDISGQLKKRMQTLQLKREAGYKRADLKFELGTGLSAASNARLLMGRLEEEGLCKSASLYVSTVPWSSSEA